MNPRSALPAAAAALSLLLAACGNKGPLVLPEPVPAETTPTAPGDVPVTIDRPVTMPQPETEGALRDPTSANPLLVDPVMGPPPPAAEPYDEDSDDATAPPADEGSADGADPDADDDGVPDEDEAGDDGGSPPPPPAHG